ncbi:phosphoenolpyruvate--protein phosphotransferase [Aureimonas flava]|uniref:Phosphoenolpyruvate-protein phosphotransferase n=1 Tax=Aureimonas flava TaxID=2320271 RepID=A0A3A1WPY0_9HYPH|nr:phosphoenolpyruvate--protein phosphotransferase [Aureimonas flava]RIY02196.1 phosphoenolpyruvate--protein phosphotransferase [Aureimonas flava]
MERSVVVRVHDGLHARPATQFVKLAKSFACDVEIRCNGRGASAKSAVKLMLLGVKENDEATLRAEGDDAAEAVSALATFLQTPDAGEVDLSAPRPADGPATAAAPVAAGERGVAASEGTAIGPAFPFFPAALEIRPRTLTPDAVVPERARYRAALAATISSFREARAKPGLRRDDAAIIEALVEVAEDADFIAAAEDAIGAGRDAESAVESAGRAIAESFEALTDPYLRARAEDIRSVTRAIVLALLGRRDTTLADLPKGAVIVADEIAALDLAKATLADIGGIVCRKGAATSHVAIMARAHGIPAVLGFGVDAAHLRDTRTVALDGASGEVVLDPDEPVAARFRGAIAREAEERTRLAAYRTVEPRTRDGRRIEIAANLGSLAEIDAALAAGAMGVGLFRTEFLFMERRTLPGEEEQTETYVKLAQAFAPHPVVIRTLDIGGDKPVAGIDFEHEDNPFLGWRGVRMCLERPDVFKPQLRALLRASAVGNVKVLLPMIADVGEVRAVRALIGECRAELDASGHAHGAFELGVMVETPAAVFVAAEIAREVDFFSVGTNDLTQYVMAADRLNARVAKLNRTEHPAVLAAIRMAAAAAREAGIWIGVCGEAAARPDLIPFFVENGVTELSMSPASIPRAKKCVTEI